MMLPDFLNRFLPPLIIRFLVLLDIIMSEFIINPTDAATMPPIIIPLQNRYAYPWFLSLYLN
jgi:hypothetical protein